ncbi:hypothetical protein V1503_23785 [Bacillus sp. SCS-151]|uniref:hypothetical protein n=1 Tax=Nanhaiella sioensis TaxID=3115293 RepID=UPI00397961AB
MSTNGTSYLFNYAAPTMGFKTDRNPFGEINIHEHSESGSKTWSESIDYDGFGNISFINRNDSQMDFEYDELNRIVQENLTTGARGDGR